ncbi:MAG: cell division protein FtsZ [Bacteroidetes bacterium]|nr:cell division protein FtsZ [Bacteroidota bacterium]
MIEFDKSMDLGAKIRVVGVGGGGSNAVNGMISRGLTGVDFVCINTDTQALSRCSADNKIQIGKNLTRGLGAGADPTIGHRAAEEDKEEIARMLNGSDMVFITAGMGGGTGTGAGPVIANIAKSMGALVVGIVTKPFNCEGKKRFSQAEYGLEEMKKQVDTLIVIPNQKLLSIVERTTPLEEAFEICNSVLYGATRGISELITVPGLINLDFADVRTIMREMGDALMGTGISSGENRAVEAANKAISSELLEGVSIAGAQGVIVNITGGKNMSLFEVEEATEIIHREVGEDANVILGAVIDEKMTDEIMVTVIATGFKKRKEDHLRIPKKSSVIDVPTGVINLRKFDEPTFIRQGLEISQVNTAEEDQKEYKQQTEDDRPAFLRKIMD